MRAPPSAHFRNREGSCRNPWVLGRRQLRPWDPCPYLRRRAVRPPTPGTLLLFLPPVPGKCTVDHRYQTTRLPDYHHSDLTRVTIFSPTVSYLTSGIRYLAIKRYLGTADEAISVLASTISWSAGPRTCPFLIGWPRCQIRISRPAMAISISIPPCHRQKTMPLSICQSGFASLLPKKTGCRRFSLESGCQAVLPLPRYCTDTAGQGCTADTQSYTTPPPASSTSHRVANTPFATAPLLCVLAPDWQLISALRLLQHCDTATAVACPVRKPYAPVLPMCALLWAMPLSPPSYYLILASRGRLPLR